MQNLKEQILSNINIIFTYDFSKVYLPGDNKQPWNNFTDKEIEGYVKNIFSILKKIEKNINTLDLIGAGNIGTFSSYVQGLVTAFTNTNISNIHINQITTQHHEILSGIENINNFLRNTGIYSEIEITSNQIKKANKEFIEVQGFLDSLIAEKPKYESALVSLKDLINKQGEVNTATLNGQADAFKKRAESYIFASEFKGSIFSGGIKFWKWQLWKINGNCWWLLITLIFSLVTGGIVIHFIIGSTNNIEVSAGHAILRIASMAVPSYLTVFSASQYLYGKKMHESYMFKFASLQTMNSLIVTNSELKERILSRGLDVLFTEPNLKGDSSKDDKQILMELLNMLKGQLKT